MIIFRYLTREIFASLSAIVGVLLLIFLSNQFVRYLNQAASGKFAGAFLLHLMAIEIPHLLAVLLPLSLFLGILLAYSRLYADNEMTVLNASGLSQQKLLALTLPVTLVITLIVGVLTLWLNPQLLAYRDQLIMQSGTALALETTLPGRFRQANDGKRVLYIESLSPDKKRMQNIFFAQLNKNDDHTTVPLWSVFTAQSGSETIDPKTGQKYFVAVNGRRYQGTPGTKDFQIIQYGTYSIHIGNQTADISDQQETFPTARLLRPARDAADKAELITELEWRLSLPLSAVLLTLLAIPLSRIKPRQGRYAKLIPAILIYATYTNLLLFARNWVMDGKIPLFFGLWWIHALLLLLILFIWANQTGWRNMLPFLTFGQKK